MGTCCSIDIRCGKFENDDMKERGYYEYYKEDEAEQNSDVKLSASGATVRLRGSSMRTSMFSQQGKKGVNQDAMTVWEVCIPFDFDDMFLLFGLCLICV